jgi:hypothetical protein
MQKILIIVEGAPDYIKSVKLKKDKKTTLTDITRRIADSLTYNSKIKEI